MKTDKPVLVERKQSAEAGYHPQVWYEGWRVAYLNDTPQFHRENVKQMQRHNTSDEVFVLLEGSLTLCIGDGTGETPGRVTEMELERGVIYNVKKGVWHTHTLPARVQRCLSWKMPTFLLKTPIMHPFAGVRGAADRKGGKRKYAENEADKS